MNRDLVETVILPYVGEHFEDASYLAKAFGDFGVRALVDAAMEGLRARQTNNDEFNWILGFLTDAVRPNLLADELRCQVLAAAEASDFYRILEEGLRCDAYYSRSSCIKALGRWKPEGASQMLLGALPFYEVRDPLNIRDLVYEMTWMAPMGPPEGEQHPLIDRVLSHPHFLWRWQVMEWLEVRPIRRAELTPEREAHIAWQQGWLEKLLQDPSPEIQAESRLRWELAKHQWDGDSIDKKESRRRLREIRRTFDPRRYHAGLSFWSWKHENDPASIDYTADEFESYVRNVWPTLPLRKP